MLRRLTAAIGTITTAFVIVVTPAMTSGAAAVPPPDSATICADKSHSGNSFGINFPNGGNMGLDIRTCLTSHTDGSWSSYIWIDWHDYDNNRPGHPFDGFKIRVNMENFDDPFHSKTCDVLGAMNAGGTTGSAYCETSRRSPLSWSFYTSTDGYLSWDIDNDGLGYRPNHGLTGSPVFSDSHGDTRHEIAVIANGQLGNPESGTNCNKYSTALGHGCQEWCADFVNWVYKQAGGIDRSGINSLADSLRTYGGPYHPIGDGFSPLPGDAILYDWDPRTGVANHVGIVVSNINGVIASVEGNRGDKVSKITSHGGILGYTGIDWS